MIVAWNRNGASSIYVWHNDRKIMTLEQNISSSKLKSCKLTVKSKSNGYKNLFPIVWYLLIYGEV